jgi:hypothetical protein
MFIITHGKRHTRVYRCWAGMKQRCTNPNDKGYYRYGGRGITIEDPLWLTFEPFYADMGEPPTPQHSLERKDNNRGYCKENCVWATKKAQANNRRTNHLIEYQGQTKTLSQWSDYLNIPYNNLINRIDTWHWDIHRAFTQPIHKRHRIHHMNILPL